MLSVFMRDVLIMAIKFGFDFLPSVSTRIITNYIILQLTGPKVTAMGTRSAA